MKKQERKNIQVRSRKVIQLTQLLTTETELGDEMRAVVFPQLSYMSWSSIIYISKTVSSCGWCVECGRNGQAEDLCNFDSGQTTVLKPDNWVTAKHVECYQLLVVSTYPQCSKDRINYEPVTSHQCTRSVKAIPSSLNR